MNVIPSVFVSLVLYSSFFWLVSSVNLNINFPPDLNDPFGNGQFTLDYSPIQGFPPPNSSVSLYQIQNGLLISQARPGSQYSVNLYFENQTYPGILVWYTKLFTAPNPPTNLTTSVSRTSAKLNWLRPLRGDVSSYKLRVIPYSDVQNSVQNIHIPGAAPPFVLHDLVPGASYGLELYTRYKNISSAVPATVNVTTTPNVPGRFIVWFRNQTTMLVLWQLPYPPGVFSRYRVSIDPPHAHDSVLVLEKTDGPSQAAFYGLQPGHPYNISIQTVSGSRVSAPTSAQYRTIPLAPENVTIDRPTLGTGSFSVRWLPPVAVTVFDRYVVSVDEQKRYVSRGSQLEATFDSGLLPGVTYQVEVKTQSANVLSWPAKANVTTRPLAVENLTVRVGTDETSVDGAVLVQWTGAVGSRQDQYRVSYHDQAALNDSVDTVASVAVSDSAVLATAASQLLISGLLPGRNYSIAVQALSSGVAGAVSFTFYITRPSTPIIEQAVSVAEGLSLSWKSDVNSLQRKYVLTYTRNDTAERHTLETTRPEALLTDLYAGAVYNIKIYSLSNGVQSAPHEYYQTMRPNPARNLSVVSLHSDRLQVGWLPPLFSRYDGFVLEYGDADTLSTSPNAAVTSLQLPSATRGHQLSGLLPGWRYTISVFTHSGDVRSSLAATATVRLPPAKAAVGSLRVIMATHNASLVWTVGSGRADRYVIAWWASEDSGGGGSTVAVAGRGSSSEERQERVLTGQDTSDGRLVLGVPALWPGRRYVFEVYAEANGLESGRVQVANRTLPVITSEIRVERDRHIPRELIVHFTPTPFTSSHFDVYQCRLREDSEWLVGRDQAADAVVQEQLAVDPDYSFRFRRLVSGRVYRLDLWTRSVGVNSEPRQRRLRMFPAPVTRINSTRVGNTELQLQWSRPDGDFDGFRLSYRAQPPYDPRSTVTSSGRDEIDATGGESGALQQQVVAHTSYTLQRLSPYRNYTITIHTLSGSVDANSESLLTESLPLSVVIATAESVPERVSEFEAVDRRPRQIQLRWLLPLELRNGVLHSYTVAYGEKTGKTVLTKSYGAGANGGVIGDLLPGRIYTFRIQARTRVGYGASRTLEVTTPVWPPPQPNARVFPTEVSKNGTTIRVRFRRNYFSDKNGAVIGYSVVVAEDHRIDASGLELPTWLDVQSYSVWPPFQVNVPYNPFDTNKSVEDFTIGTDSACLQRCAHVPAGRCYCNGPLRAGTSYRVKIRAFTRADMFADTAYSQPIHTRSGPRDRLLTVGVPLLLLVATMAGLAGLVMLRRRRWGPFRGPSGAGTLGAGMKDLRRHRDDDISMHGSVIETSRPVKLKDFLEHYRFMAADSDIRFSEEYEDLKHVGRDQPCVAADYPCNRPKNRFTNILPYDHSRYKLQPTDDEEGSDYINANYVPGFNSPREFIVTQGPLHSTRDDFWRMVWESGSRAIVMLTRCVEKGREKCDRYWPCDTQPQYYGDIQVVALNQTHLTSWSVSEFRVTRGHTARVVRHFHFTTWPDFGVPEPPQVLVRFVRAFRDRVPYDQRPIITHCSAGVGRSGTFIALDRLLQHIGRYDYVDVFGLVYGMRKERVLMVQTEVQYICIYTSVKVVLEGTEDDDLIAAGATLTPGAGTPGLSHPVTRSLGVGDAHHVNVGFDDDEGIVESGM